MQNTPTFDEAIQAVMKHVTDRHWDDNPPRGLAISIALEASELLEHFQWKDSPVGNKDELADELADILIYSIQFAQHYQINMSQSIMQKLVKSAKKYPLKDFSDIHDPDQRHHIWLQAKKNYTKDTTL